MERLEASVGRAPDLDSVRILYCPDDAVTELPQDEEGRNVFRVVVDGTVVRFTEESRSIRIRVEGRLWTGRLRQIQESARDKLSAPDGAAWEIEEV